MINFNNAGGVDETNHTEAYVVNLALAPLVWDAEPYQIKCFLNPSWLNSAWLGTVWNVVMVPMRLWHEVIAPLLRGDLGRAARMLVVGIPFTFLMFLLWGLIGRARATRLSAHTLTNAYFLTEDEAARAIRAGDTQLLRIRA